MNRTLRQRLRLGLLRRLARFTPPLDSPAPLPPAPRLLIVRPDHLGDLLFITPALRQLRQAYPKAHVTALIGPWGRPVLADNPHVDQIIELAFPGFARRPKPSIWQPYTLLRDQARALRDRFDLAYILRFDHWWGALLATLAGIPRRVGYAIPEVRPFLTDPRPYVPNRHAVEQNLALVSSNSHLAPRTSQFAIRTSHLEFHPPAPAIRWAQEQFGGGSPIAIHPGTGAPVKLWRVAGWATVADALAQTSGAPIALTGSAAERPMCQTIAQQMSSPAQVLAGETDLGQLAALFACCRLVLGPDSGPLHLAVALGTPTVHLYGPADPTLFGPWGPAEHHRVLTSAWPCVPCGRLDYPSAAVADHPCVRAIRVEQVLATAWQALEHASDGRGR